jgi:hypothetical protein
MNLQENIHRIQSLLTENRDEMIKNMIPKHGLYYTIKLMGELPPDMEKYISIEDMIDFIKTTVTELCDEEDDIEVGGHGFYPVPIVYEETEDQIHLIEFYRPEGVVIERYVTGGDDYDDEDNYIGSHLKRYEQLSPSILTEIFHLMITKI